MSGNLSGVSKEFIGFIVVGIKKGGRYRIIIPTLEVGKFK
jgi:hypothetical protein